MVGYMTVKMHVDVKKKKIHKEGHKVSLNLVHCKLHYYIH